MAKWVAQIREDDDPFGEEILLGIDGGRNGFEIILSNFDASDAMPGLTPSEAMENLEDFYGDYETFEWI